MSYGTQALVPPPASYPQMYPQVVQQTDPFNPVMATSVPQQASAPALTEQQSLAQSIDAIMGHLACRRTDIREQTRAYRQVIAHLKGHLRELEKLEEGKVEEVSKTALTYERVRDWVAANKGLVFCSIAVVGLASMFSLKNISLPAIPIRIEGGIKIKGGGVYVQKTSFLDSYTK